MRKVQGNSPELVQFAQRIGSEYHLTALDLEETRNYIQHRLKVVNGNPLLFILLAATTISRKSQKKVLEKFKKFNPDEIGISAITLAELEYSVAKSQHPDKNQQALAEFILPLEVLPFDHYAAQAYGNIRTLLEKREHQLAVWI